MVTEVNIKMYYLLTYIYIYAHKKIIGKDIYLSLLEINKKIHLSQYEFFTTDALPSRIFLPTLLATAIIFIQSIWEMHFFITVFMMVLRNR